MEAKYNIGDIFVRKGVRDGNSYIVKEIVFMPTEPVYVLEPYHWKIGYDIELGESAVDELYVKTNG